MGFRGSRFSRGFLHPESPSVTVTRQRYNQEMAIAPYLHLMDRIISARTEDALRAVIPAIREFVALDPVTRFDFGETWSRQWSAVVPEVVPPELWDK